MMAIELWNDASKSPNYYIVLFSLSLLMLVSVEQFLGKCIFCHCSQEVAPQIAPEQMKHSVF